MALRPQPTMKKTVFCIFLALNFPVFAEIDLPNRSKIPLRGSLGLNHEDAGNGRLSCSLVNETDRDWLVCVDESGEIVPKSVPEDARSSDIVDWIEIETFPNVFQRDGWHLEAVSNRIP